MTNKKLPAPENPWDTRFGWLRLTADDTFGRSDNLEERIDRYVQTGINHVILWNAHFRWQHLRHWDKITALLARVVEGFHTHGVYVTEHHSAHLTYNPVTLKEEERLVDYFSEWPHLKEDTNADPEIIDGVRISQMRQIDGRTGSYAYTHYTGWGLCFNNPYYRKAYFAHLADIYATGVDGIMTDDVQWFGREVKKDNSCLDGNYVVGHACACQYCRKLFSERTGFELPNRSKWDMWHGDYSDPSYRAWLDFRFRTIEDFHEAVKDHYESLGLRMLRPNYMSGVFGNNPTAYCLDSLPHLDWIFLEFVNAAVIRYSWPKYMLDAVHRHSVGRRRNIPPMVMFYPKTPNNCIFSWVLAQSWGVLFTGSYEPGKQDILQSVEIPLRRFEQQHAGLLQNSQKFARLAIYDSRRNREMYKKLNQRTIPCLCAWTQACYMENIPFDLFQIEDIERIKTYDIVILNEIAVLSLEEKQAFLDFVNNGGTLVCVGRNGILDETGEFVENNKDHDDLNFCLSEDIDALSKPKSVQQGKGTIEFVPYGFGKGLIESIYSTNRSCEYKPLSDDDREARSLITGYIRTLFGDTPDLDLKNVPEGVLVSSFLSRDKGAILLHIVNASGTLSAPSGGKVSGLDDIPFPTHKSSDKMEIVVRGPENVQEQRVSSVLVHRVSVDQSVSADFSETDGYISVEIPCGLLKDYLLVEISL